MGLKHHEILMMTLNDLNRYINSWVKKRKDDDRMADIRTARICCVIANANSKRKFKEKDFMPKQKSEKMSAEQFVNVLKAVTLAHGGEVKLG